MRTRWFSPMIVVLAAVMLSAPATAQTIAYTNFLQFDLQSYRSQATGGMFDDDIENVSDAAKLMNVEGNRLFTSFSNLADPAGFGDNILSYSVDHFGAPSDTDHFDTGSYLVGWIGKYKKDSEYNASVFYQRNSARGMFEDLDGLGGFDAEANGTLTSTTTVSTDPYDVTGIDTLTFDLMHYSQRSATDFDLGLARDMSEDLSVGGRVFFEKDQLDFFSSGTYESNSVDDIDTDPAVINLQTTDQDRTEFFGNGEDAYQYRRIGVSLNADQHSWENQSVGVRLDIFGAKENNPGMLSSTPSTFSEVAPWLNGVRINLGTDTDYDFYYTLNPSTGVTGSANDLQGNQMDSDTNTFTYTNLGRKDVTSRGSLATESIDDERSGLGFALKGEYNREWAGGEINSWAGFGSHSMDIDATQIMVSRSERRRWWSDGTSDFEAVNTDDQTDTVTRTGDATGNTLEAGGRWNRDLNSNVSLGVGGVVSRVTYKDDYRAVTQSVRTVTRDDGESGQNTLYNVTFNADFFEGSDTRTVTTTFDVEDEEKVTTLRLPVGAQFHFRDRWTFNMGATHTQTNTNREMNLAAPAGLNGVFVDVSVDSAGVATETHGTNEETGNITVTDKTRSNHTTYWYGVSVDITDACQLDVNGFLDTNSGDHTTDDAGRPTGELTGGGSLSDVAFWRNLAVSLKFIFW